MAKFLCHGLWPGSMLNVVRKAAIKKKKRKAAIKNKLVDLKGLKWGER